MSPTVDQTRRRLPLYYLALPLSAGLALLWPQWPLLTDLSLWYLWPLWVGLAHLSCGLSHFITSGKLHRAKFLLKNSLQVYRSFGSLVHLQAALLVALAEEALFRYVGLGWITWVSGSAALAWALTTLVFGLAHLPTHFHGGATASKVRRLLDLTLFGGLLGALVLVTRSFWPAFVVHGLRNYILRCLLVSKEEYAHYHAERLIARIAAQRVEGTPGSESAPTATGPDTERAGTDHHGKMKND